MFSSHSEKPTFSEKIKQELQREEKPQTGSYTLLLLLVLLLIALVFFFVALIKNCTTEKVAESETTTPAAEQSTTPNNQNEEAIENSAEEEITPETSNSGQTYTIQAGDTLFEIGQKFGIDWKKIAKVNSLEAPYNLTVGKTLVIPPKESSGGTTR